MTRLCMQSIKEHNLKANHNFVLMLFNVDLSVCNLSKNTIWKQITTCFTSVFILPDLYAIYQRTQSESKSQLLKQSIGSGVVCMQSIKEHNLKANHNDHVLSLSASHSVCNLSKNTIWKQITTPRCKLLSQRSLYAIYQRTQSESKSQLGYNCESCHSFCMQSIKEHNLKANHNCVGFAVQKFALYAIYQRTQSESKSQR